MFPHLIFGIIGTLLVVLATRRLAKRRSDRPAAGLAVAAILLFGIIYIALLQTIVLYVHPQSGLFPHTSAETLYLGYAGMAALVSVAITFGLAALFLRFAGLQPAEGGRFKSGLKGAVVCVLVVVGAAPFLIHNQATIGRAIAANEAEIAALRTSYTAGLEKLVKLGIVKKIAVDDDAVTHFVTAPLYKLGAKGLAEYAKASLIYHIYVTEGEPKPIVIRNADNGQKVGTYHADGIFLLEADAEATLRAAQ